jgi:hypothetical protein
MRVPIKMPPRPHRDISLSHRKRAMSRQCPLSPPLFPFVRRAKDQPRHQRALGIGVGQGPARATPRWRGFWHWTAARPGKPGQKGAKDVLGCQWRLASWHPGIGLGRRQPLPAGTGEGFFRTRWPVTRTVFTLAMALRKAKVAIQSLPTELPAFLIRTGLPSGSNSRF